MKTITKILMGTAAFSLLACSENSGVATPETHAVLPAAKVKVQETSCFEGNCANEEYEYSNLVGDMMYPALIGVYSDMNLYNIKNFKLDMNVMAYYSSSAYKKLNVLTQSGLNEIDMETLSKIPDVVNKLNKRGVKEGCRYYIVDNKIPEYRSINALTKITPDTIEISQVRSSDVSCESISEPNSSEAYFIEDCDNIVTPQTQVVVRTLQDSQYGCDDIPVSFGRWFRSDLYYGGEERPVEIPKASDSLEIDVLGVCYSTCAPGTEICTDECGEHSYEIAQFLDSLSKAFPKTNASGPTIPANNDAEYSFQSESEVVYKNDLYKVEKFSEENGFQISFDAADGNWAKEQVLIKKIRSIPVIIELYRGDYKTAEETDKVKDRITSSCYYGASYVYPAPGEGTFAVACVTVNYDEKTLEQEVERYSKYIKNLEDTPVSWPIVIELKVLY